MVDKIIFQTLADKSPTEGLRGKFLVATSELNNSQFERAVIYIVSQGEDGTMGVMVNRPLEKISFKDIAISMGIEEMMAARVNGPNIFSGGPVDNNRGFVLHSEDYRLPSTITVSPNIALSATAEIVGDIARGAGPRQMNFCLGYAGWAPGQLEDELHGNGWLVVPADENILFTLPPARRYGAATRKLGLNALNFHDEIGRA